MNDVQGIFRRYFPLIRQKCRRMLGDAAEADDVAQETFIRLWRAGLGEADGRSVLGWIYRTCTRLAIDRLRERSRNGAGDEGLAEVPAATASSDDALAARRELAVLARALPAGELEVALLFRLDRLSQDEIAEVLGVSSRTVRRTLRRLDARVAALRKEALP